MKVIFTKSVLRSQMLLLVLSTVGVWNQIGEQVITPMINLALDLVPSYHTNILLQD